MARIVITDAGPLIALAGIDALFILQSLFSEVSVAESVKCECLAIMDQATRTKRLLQHEPPETAISYLDPGSSSIE